MVHHLHRIAAAIAIALNWSFNSFFVWSWVPHQNICGLQGTKIRTCSLPYCLQTPIRFGNGDAASGGRHPSPVQRPYVFNPLQVSQSSKDASSVAARNKDDGEEKQDVGQASQLTAEQLDFVLGYLNKHHSDLLKSLVEAFSAIGSEMAKANAWSGGSFAIAEAKIIDIDTQQMSLDVTVQRRGKKDQVERVSFPIRNTEPIGERRRFYETAAPVPEHEDVAPASGEMRQPIDDVIRHLCRMCWIVKKPAITGKLIQLAIQLGGAGIGKLPENLYLNQVPHNRYVRQYFYDLAANAVLDAVVLCSQQKCTNRMQVISQFPEMNPSMDSYRIGTILEMVRSIAIRLAEQNLRVRVCVQGSMGVGIFTGVPKQLSGVSRLVQAMDWQSGEGETNEGMVGDYVRFGAVGAEHVMDTIVDSTTNEVLQHQDDVFVIIAPQSMVGTDSSIFPLLSAMVNAAKDRPVVLINPDLSDKVSAAGQQSVRGRQERIDFANSFETIFQFQNTYVSGTSYFPILGAMTKLAPSHPWVAHQRRDYANNEGEIYVPILACEVKPDSASYMEAMQR